MGEGRSQALWAHTSHVLALVANVNRDPKKTTAFEPSDFNPHARKTTATAPARKVSVTEAKSVLKNIFRIKD